VTRILAACLLALSLAGCNLIGFDQNRGWFRIANRTDHIVDVYIVGRGEVPLVLELGSEGYYPVDQSSDRRCTSGDLVVRDHQTGDELLRRTEPVCKGDDWVITLPGTPRPSPT
jgi:hypothetical protein